MINQICKILNDGEHAIAVEIRGSLVGDFCMSTPEQVQFTNRLIDRVIELRMDSWEEVFKIAPDCPELIQIRNADLASLRRIMMYGTSRGETHGADVARLIVGHPNAKGRDGATQVTRNRIFKTLRSRG